MVSDRNLLLPFTFYYLFLLFLKILFQKYITIDLYTLEVI